MCSDLDSSGLGPDAKETPWLEFVDENGDSYFYNVITNETAATPGGTADSSVPTKLGVVAPQPSPRSMPLHAQPPSSSRKRADLSMPAALCYKSWYNERGQKHYMDIHFSPKNGSFHVVVQRGVAFDLPQVCGLGGRPLEAWDLYVGAKLSLLGKPTILKQCDCVTGEWNQAQQRRLLAERG